MASGHNMSHVVQIRSIRAVASIQTSVGCSLPPPPILSGGGPNRYWESGFIIRGYFLSLLSDLGTPKSELLKENYRWGV